MSQSWMKNPVNYNIRYMMYNEYAEHERIPFKPYFQLIFWIAQ